MRSPSDKAASERLRRFSRLLEGTCQTCPAERLSSHRQCPACLASYRKAAQQRRMKARNRQNLAS